MCAWRIRLEPSLMLGQLSFVLALRELALEPAQRPVHSDDTTNGQPAVKAQRKADDGDERRDDGNDEEKMRSSSEVSQNDVYRCQNVGPER
jgi:hypothetical protein